MWAVGLIFLVPAIALIALIIAVCEGPRLASKTQHFQVYGYPEEQENER